MCSMGLYRDVMLLMLSAAISFVTADPRVWLDVPVAGDCRGDTIITCYYTDLPLATWTWSRKFGDSWQTFIVNGTQTGPTPGSVREKKINGSSFSLITEYANNMARGWYKCSVGSYEAKQRYVDVECKPINLIVSRADDQHLEIILADVHPIPKISLTLMDSSSRTVALDFQHYCAANGWTITCKWISTTPLPIGSFSYKLVVTTITDTVFTGNIN
ncbi:uncharacterized protein LOC132715620 isoform X1 [Ruditapes philippinarum]|uniref:uncharacterized protein LOC132715620 isoform X1 n=1 Tax=Ruditapes philippinarum TaxID=129788 RepID=UPI00295C1F28|nr:uncharacterized protein LOC132715620 isoform X1 [Ruditapes philippinarum]